MNNSVFQEFVAWNLSFTEIMKTLHFTNQSHHEQVNHYSTITQQILRFTLKQMY